MLISIAEDETPGEKINRLVTAFLCILWNKILQRVNATDTSKLDLDMVQLLIQWFVHYQILWRIYVFETVKMQAKQMSVSTLKTYKFESSVKDKHADSSTPAHCLTGAYSFHCEGEGDKLRMALWERQNANKENCDYFGFLSLFNRLTWVCKSILQTPENTAVIYNVS